MIVCGARFTEDLVLLREYDSIFLGVRADDGVRYARALRDPAKNGRPSFAQFLKMNRGPKEGDVSALMPFANYVFENNGTVAELRTAARKYLAGRFPIVA